MRKLVSKLLKELNFKSATVNIDARKVLINRINGSYEILSFNLFNDKLSNEYFNLSPTFLMEHNLKMKDLEILREEIRNYAINSNCVTDYHSYFQYKDD